MFADYNKGDIDATRIGNWQEELVLKDVTGYKRAPIPGPELHKISYNSRLIEHTERVDPKDYVTTTHAAYVDCTTLSSQKLAGKRSELLDAEIKAFVDQEMEAKEKAYEFERGRGTYDTSHKSESIKILGIDPIFCIREMQGTSSTRVQLRIVRFQSRNIQLKYTHCNKKKAIHLCDRVALAGDIHAAAYTLVLRESSVYEERRPATVG